jgi:pantothenate kinase
VNVLRSIDEVARVIEDAGPDRILVGIAGAPGAGKSTIASELNDRLGPSSIVLPMDGFHLPGARLVELGRRERMGAPDTFDTDAFVRTLTALRGSPRAPFRNDGESVRAPSFNREIEEPVPESITITPSFRKVVVEGNYLLLDSGGWERVAPLLDLTFYVDVARDIRIRRLIDRHVAFGKSEADARGWALGTDESNARLIEATASRADYRISLDPLG